MIVISRDHTVSITINPGLTHFSINVAGHLYVINAHLEFVSDIPSAGHVPADSPERCPECAPYVAVDYRGFCP